MTFHFIILKIPSFARVISFFFIPNIRNIDNKVREKGDKKIRQKKCFFSVERGFEPWPLTWMLFWLLYSLDSMLVEYSTVGNSKRSQTLDSHFSLGPTEIAQGTHFGTPTWWSFLHEHKLNLICPSICLTLCYLKCLLVSLLKVSRTKVFKFAHNP